MAKKIMVETVVATSLEKAWEIWTVPEHIVKWNQASDDWHTTTAENDPRTGGKFRSRMEAKDGSFGFDFEGTYDEVREHGKISYTLPDQRHVDIHFYAEDGKVRIVEKFDAEAENPVEMQQAGWQAILESFRRYAENI